MFETSLDMLRHCESRASLRPSDDPLFDNMDYNDSKIRHDLCLHAVQVTFSSGESADDKVISRLLAEQNDQINTQHTTYFEETDEGMNKFRCKLKHLIQAE